MALAPDGDATNIGTAASLDDLTLQTSCDEASAEIDARLGGRYAVPFTLDPISGTLPPLVFSVAVSISAYLATLLIRQGQPVDTTDPVFLRYTRAEMLLAQIQSGAAVIIQPVDQGQEPSTSDVTVANPYVGELFPMESFGLRGNYDVNGRWFTPFPR